MTEEEFDELRPSAFAIAYRMLSSIVNPDKLRHLGPAADLQALLRRPSSRS
jgi:hypothetical protein